MFATRYRMAAGAAVVTLMIGFAIASQAQSQFNASPNWVPIGVASGAGSNVAWFHEPSSRQALACRLVEGQGAIQSAVVCTSGRLP